MNPTIRNLPGHVYAPGHQPRGPSASDWWGERVFGALVNMADMALPFVMALSGALLVWVIIETIRARSRARRRRAIAPPPAVYVPEMTEFRARRVAKETAKRSDDTGTLAQVPCRSRLRQRREPFTRASLHR
jgi:hypothetical protein